MKGIILAEFMEFAEGLESVEFVDTLVDNTQPASGGAYTSIGTYDYRELVNMVVEWSKQKDTPIAALLEAFGKHAFGRFVQGYP